MTRYTAIISPRAHFKLFATYSKSISASLGLHIFQHQSVTHTVVSCTVMSDWRLAKKCLANHTSHSRTPHELQNASPFHICSSFSNPMDPYNGSILWILTLVHLDTVALGKPLYEKCKQGSFFFLLSLSLCLTLLQLASEAKPPTVTAMF